MPVRARNVRGKFIGKDCVVTVSNGIPKDIQFAIRIGWDQYGLHIKDAEKTLLPALKDMYPHWFVDEEILDRIDTAVVEGQPKSVARTDEEEAYERGYIDALELMQQEMNEILKERKNG